MKTIVLEAILVLIAVSAWALDIPVGEETTLSIEMTSVNVAIQGWDEGKVNVAATGIEYEYAANDGRLELREKESTSPDASIEIKLPRFMRVELVLDDGNVVVSEIENRIGIAVDHGDIILDGTDGSYDIAVGTGNIAANIFISGESRFRVVDGNISLSILNTESVPIDVETGNGDITVRLAEGYNANVEAFASEGGLTTDFRLLDSTDDRGSIRGRIGEGGPLLRTVANRGSVQIKKVALPDTDETATSKTIIASATVEKPKIDGYPNDKAWWDGTWTDGESFSAMFTFDSQRIYGLLVVAVDPESLKAYARERDEKLRDDSQIELEFIREKIIYSIAVNPIGTINDRRGQRIGKQVRWDYGWNPDVDCVSGYGDGFWVVEISIPLDAVVVDLKEGVGISISVKAGSVIEKWGEENEVRMIFNDASRESLFARVRNLKLTPTEDLSAILGIAPNQDVPIDRLEFIRHSLALTGFFKEVNFEISAQTEDEIDLVVETVPEPTYRVDKIEFSGEPLPLNRMERLFALAGGSIPKKRVDVVAKMLKDLKRSEGQDLVQVNIEEQGNILEIAFEEGKIVKLDVRGNRTIKTVDVQNLFGELPMLFGRRSEIDEKVKSLEQQLKQKYDLFRSVRSWSLKEVPGGYILVLQIGEEEAVVSKFRPVLDFNRVQGGVLGVRFDSNSKLYFGERVFIDFRYGFSNARWNYSAGLEKGVLHKGILAIGGQVYRTTDTNDRNQVSDIENLLGELLLGNAYRDYYEREGWEVFSHIRVTKRFSLLVGYRDDTYRSMPKETDWYLFKEDLRDAPRVRVITSRSEMWWIEPEEEKRENPPIDDGEMRSFWARCCLDLRDKPQTAEHNYHSEPTPSNDTRNGWLLSAGAEIAGGDLGGDFTFEQLEFMIARYNQIGRNRLDIRVMGSYAQEDETLPEQRKKYIGGLGTVRGLGYKEFSDNALLLVNLDYGLKMLGPIWVNVFFDVGYLWYVEETHSSMGFGLSAGPVRVDFAQALEDLDREPVVSLRISRMF